MVKAVFVIGAGASCEFGFPSGDQLKTEIIKELSYAEPSASIQSGGRFAEAIECSLGRYTHSDVLRAKKQCLKIKRGLDLAQSIDNFLHLHKDNQLLVTAGKIAISSVILKAELKSSLKIKDESYSAFPEREESQGIEKPHNTWIGALFTILSSQRNFKEFCTILSNIVFISFNYDRCIQVFFHVACKNLYPEELYNPSVLNSSINIINPYGNLGPINDYTDAVQKFGDCSSGQSIWKSSKNIKTFTEGFHDSVQIDEIHNFLRKTDILVFLGYGFIGLNNKMFERDKEIFTTNHVLATAYGQSKPNTEEIKRFINNRFRKAIGAGNSTYALSGATVSNTKCSELIRDWNRRLEGLLGV